MTRPTYFINDATVTTRKSEVPAADFDGGMNLGGSNAPAIGVNVDGGAVVGTPAQFTLADQFGNTRVPQDSQHIGGSGHTDPSGWPSSGGDAGVQPDKPVNAATPSVTGDGTVTAPFAVDLVDTATGWTAA